MKRALFLAYEYFPSRAPGASLRTRKLVRYLPEFGWDAHVVCRDDGGEEAAPSGGTREVPVRAIADSRLAGFSYQLGAWTWSRRLLPEARRLIREWRPDLIYSSHPPFPHAFSAVRLAREAGLPLAIDLRDSWSLDPHLSGPFVKRTAKRALLRWIYPGWERRILSSANAVVLNTPSMAAEYSRRFADLQDRFRLAPNGFDEADFAGTVVPPARRRPQLAYCGRFSRVGDRSPMPLLRAIKELIAAGRELDLLILGDDSDFLRKAVRDLQLQDFVLLKAAAPHADAIRTMREADIVVVCQAPGRSGVSPVAAKTYEYLRSGRPILAIVPPGDNADLVRRYAACSEIVHTDRPGLVAAALARLIDHLPNHHALVDEEFAARYSRRGIAKEAAEIFDAIAGLSPQGASGSYDHSH